MVPLEKFTSSGSKWCVVNQDTLGSRQACLKVARNALTRPPNERGHIVIDRCNVTGAVWGLGIGEGMLLGTVYIES